MGTSYQPVEPKKRIDFIDILRGFALLGILFNNILLFSGYDFMPLQNLRLFSTFNLDSQLWEILDVVVTGKFYTLFSILFGVGFYLQWSKKSHDFLQVYRRRLFILLIFGFIHSLIWFGDILFLYALVGFILLLFRNVKTKNLLRLSILFIFGIVLFDLIMMPLAPTFNNGGTTSAAASAHVYYPDMSPAELVEGFKTGNIAGLFSLNIHNLIWKWLSYFPSGRVLNVMGAFILGYFLASTEFFTKHSRSLKLLITFLLFGVLSTIFMKIIDGSMYQFSTTVSQFLYKLLVYARQVSLCLFYICLLSTIAGTAPGKKILDYLRPVGRMALTNYIMQTVICLILFYNFGFNLFGRLGLVTIVFIAIGIVTLQIVLSTIWFKYFRFGPLEWLWRTLTYRKRIQLRVS